jgi:hypothetical protein
MTFATAALKFFGKRSEGQSLSSFMAELKELTAQDRVELAQLLSKELGEDVEA